MLRYFLFSLKSILYKKSYYISTFVYLITLILVTYLFPAILRQSFISVLNQWFIWTMVVLAIAITITMSTIFVFKSGIEDGTEILISSKPISRADCVWAKLLLMFIIIVVQSFLSFVIALFLPLAKYGIKENMPIAGGFFIFSFIVSLFFCATGMIFALISKQQAAMFLNFSLGFLLVLITSINVVLSKVPGKIIKDEGYSLTNKMSIPTYDKKTNKKSYSEGYLLKYKNKIIDKNSINLIPNNANVELDNIIEHVYTNAYNSSSFTKTVNIDPVYQWINLLNTSNFYLDPYTSPYWYNDLSYAFDLVFSNIAKLDFSAKANKDFIRIKIDNFPDSQITGELVPINSTSTTINLINSKERENDPIFEIPTFQKSEFIFIPEYTLDQQTFLPETNSFKIHIFPKKEMISNSAEFEKLYNRLFVDNNNLYSEYEIKKAMYQKTLLQYALNYNFNDYLQEKMNNALNIILMNIEKTPNEKVPFYYNNLPIDNIIKKPIYYKDLVNELSKINNDFEYNIWNKVDYTSLSWTFMVSATESLTSQIQTIFSDKIIQEQLLNNQSSVNYNEEKSKKIINLLINKREINYNTTNPIILSDINKVANINKLIDELSKLQTTDPLFVPKQIELDYEIKQNALYFNSYFYNLRNIDNFATFANIKLDFMINGYGLIIGWIFVSSILILMASGIYARKDFK